MADIPKVRGLTDGRKTCPFCGGELKVVRYVDHLGHEGDAYSMCRSCKARTRRRRSAEEAVADWSMRHGGTRVDFLERVALDMLDAIDESARRSIPVDGAAAALFRARLSKLGVCRRTADGEGAEEPARGDEGPRHGPLMGPFALGM